MKKSNENRTSHNQKKKFLTPIQKFKKIVKKIILLKRFSLQDKTLDSYDKVKLALEKSYLNRNKKDCSAIEHYMKRLTYFSELRIKQGEFIYQNFCRCLNFKIVQDNEKIIKKDEYGQFFYVLLKGSVRVVIYKPKNVQAQQMLLNFTKLLNKGKHLQVNYDDEELFEALTIATLKDGTTFGELSLLQSNSLTTASIISTGTCELAFMDRDSVTIHFHKGQFWKYSGKQKQNEFENKLKLLKFIPFLSNWNETDLKTISYDFQSKTFYKDQIIYREGSVYNFFNLLLKQKNLGMYYIVNGEVTFQAGFFNNMVNDIELQKQINKEKRTPVSILGSNFVFGDESDENYILTAICTSLKLDVYFISKIQLEKRLMWNAKSKEIFKKSQQLSLQWRMNRKNILVKSLEIAQQQLEGENVAHKFLNFAEQEMKESIQKEKLKEKIIKNNEDHHITRLTIERISDKEELLCNDLFIQTKKISNQTHNRVSMRQSLHTDNHSTRERENQFVLQSQNSLQGFLTQRSIKKKCNSQEINEGYNLKKSLMNPQYHKQGQQNILETTIPHQNNDFINDLDLIFVKGPSKSYASGPLNIQIPKLDEYHIIKKKQSFEIGLNNKSVYGSFQFLTHNKLKKRSVHDSQASHLFNNNDSPIRLEKSQSVRDRNPICSVVENKNFRIVIKQKSTQVTPHREFKELKFQSEENSLNSQPQTIRSIENKPTFFGSLQIKQNPPQQKNIFTKCNFIKNNFSQKNSQNNSVISLFNKSTKILN